MMLHIVQSNLFNERGFQELIGALESNGCPYTVVKVVPFSHELEPDVRPDGPVMVWGATTLGHIAAERGWEPGRLQNEKFDMRYLRARFGPHFLNSDAQFCAFGNLKFEGQKFIRPVHDSKSFTGAVIDGAELEGWKRQVLDVSDGYSTLRMDTPAMHASLKEIWLEARFFIVGNKPVTGSLYRFEGRPVQRRIDGDPMFQELEEFARQMPLVDCSRMELTPAEPIAMAYALDVALPKGGGGPKVVEVNSINSSGFYKCDMGAVVRALENMVL